MGLEREGVYKTWIGDKYMNQFAECIFSRVLGNPRPVVNNQMTPPDSVTRHAVIGGMF